MLTAVAQACRANCNRDLNRSIGRNDLRLMHLNLTSAPTQQERNLRARIEQAPGVSRILSRARPNAMHCKVCMRTARIKPHGVMNRYDRDITNWNGRSEHVARHLITMGPLLMPRSQLRGYVALRPSALAGPARCQRLRPPHPGAPTPPP